MRPAPRSPVGPPSRPGLTLVELLVTVSILMLLLVVALPAITPSAESRRVREAVRQLNVFFGAARAQAMQSGRPVGVAMERTPRQPQASMTVYQVEVPPAYAGEVLNSTARITYYSANQYVAQFNMSITGFTPSKISTGDQVRLNNQGPLYTVISATGVNPVRVELDIRDRKTYPWPTSGQSPPVTYQFYRQPIRSAVAPLELPAAVAIDLQASGTDSISDYFRPWNNELNSSTPSPVVFMFSPSGSLDRVYFYSAYNTSTNTPSRVIRESIYLLVGRRDRIVVAQNVSASTPAEQYPNWFDSSSLWLVVGPQTGIVSAKENYRVPVNSGSFNSGIFMARTLARQAQTIGGR